MPKIADIEGTPNKNALKFILKEPLTWGVARSYDNAEAAKDDPLASALFDIDHVTNVFYIDQWITVTQDGEANWQDLAREIADPIRAAPAASAQSHVRGDDPGAEPAAVCVVAADWSVLLARDPDARGGAPRATATGRLGAGAQRRVTPAVAAASGCRPDRRRRRR